MYEALFRGLASRDGVLMHLPGGGSLTGRGFHNLVGRAANALVQAGVQPGDRVAVQVVKSPAALAIYAATVSRFTAKRTNARSMPNLPRLTACGCNPTA